MIQQGIGMYFMCVFAFVIVCIACIGMYCMYLHVWLSTYHWHTLVVLVVYCMYSLYLVCIACICLYYMYWYVLYVSVSRLVCIDVYLHVLSLLECTIRIEMFCKCWPVCIEFTMPV